MVDNADAVRKQSAAADAVRKQSAAARAILKEAAEMDSRDQLSPEATAAVAATNMAASIALMPELPPVDEPQEEDGIQQAVAPDQDVDVTLRRIVAEKV